MNLKKNLLEEVLELSGVEEDWRGMSRISQIYRKKCMYMCFCSSARKVDKGDSTRTNNPKIAVIIVCTP